MAKKLYPRLLEVEVFQLEPTLWEWRVFEGDTPLKTGAATSRETAQIDGVREADLKATAARNGLVFDDADGANLPHILTASLRRQRRYEPSTRCSTARLER
jgi:hypothetical protein